MFFLYINTNINFEIVKKVSVLEPKSEYKAVKSKLTI